YAKNSPCYEELKKKAPIYDNMDDFFAAHKADFTIISTPIHLHYAQCATALQNGSHVLCEKPLVPTLSALDKLEKIAQDNDKILAVGFQWCYSDVMLALKERILSGEFGKPKRLKCYVSWPRDWAYYNRGVGWAGKIKTGDGQLIHDSVASNATAHYIQNMLFLLGTAMEESAALSNTQVECYRANDIEAFDTITFRGNAGDAEVYYTAAHPTYHTIHPVMDYAFEKARIWVNVNGQSYDFMCTLHHDDGRVEELGPALGDGEKNRLKAMAKRMRGEQATLCTAHAARPFTTLINDVFEKVPFNTFPETFVVKDEQAKATFVKNLHLDLWDCFNQNKLPSEMGLPWAKEATKI
ncbi:MAG: Gfo/Idh/MocA family oxidoreductase, partial [Defluviitaleaceae bacterium]|nr:Gfo/Idh/MocA family oxidoreductase [Defluviitaleaceae bacterium]